VLLELSKQDKKWRSFALKICGCKILADDLTQDMYLKLSKYKEVNSKLVYRTLYTLFIDDVRLNKKTVLVDEFKSNEHFEEPKEIDDLEFDILERFDNIPWRQQELIQLSFEKSLRQIEKEFPMINYAYANRQIKEGIKTVLGDNFDTMYNNTRRKN
tara:strand:+ start:1117 stop:1587 length:471 start_codon:yes stop_codon:yes gene_type:complete